jgi:hypothetical protein
VIQRRQRRALEAPGWRVPLGLLIFEIRRWCGGPAESGAKTVGRQAARTAARSGLLFVAKVAGPRPDAENLFDRPHQFFHGEGLADVIAHSQHFGVGAMPAPLVACDHDRRYQATWPASEFFEDEKPALLGHHHVENEQIGDLALGDHQPGIAVTGGQDPKSFIFQHRAHGFQDFMIVIDQQDGPLLGGHGAGSHELRWRGEYPETLSHHHKRQARGEQGARHKKEQHIMNIPILVASLMMGGRDGF